MAQPEQRCAQDKAGAPGQQEVKRQPASHPASEPASQPASEPASKPASERGWARDRTALAMGALSGIMHSGRVRDTFGLDLDVLGLELTQHLRHLWITSAPTQ
jgi:hypothetical protein